MMTCIGRDMGQCEKEEGIHKRMIWGGDRGSLKTIMWKCCDTHLFIVSLRVLFFSFLIHTPVVCTIKILVLHRPNRSMV